ncbi:MAG: tRNA (adenosine(37)-N6)-threonylcarbamoyltransferase complex ATPase subunit type 1 TsaE [bacterium]
MDNLEFLAKNINDTESVAKAIAQATKDSGGLICLFGDVGAGKTTLVKFIAKYLNIKETVTSPSFVILNEYHSGDLSLYHFDLYRLETEGVKTILDELREYSESPNSLAIVEWAEFSDDELPPQRLEIHISYLDENSRKFNFSAKGTKSLTSLNKIETELKL